MSSTIYFISDIGKVRLYRYKDPVAGPRKIPAFDQPLLDKIQISNTAAFHIEAEKRKVAVTEEGQSMDVGSQLMYIVDWPSK